MISIAVGGLGCSMLVGATGVEEVAVAVEEVAVAVDGAVPVPVGMAGIEEGVKTCVAACCKAAFRFFSSSSSRR